MGGEAASWHGTVRTKLEPCRRKMLAGALHVSGTPQVSGDSAVSRRWWRAAQVAAGCPGPEGARGSPLVDPSRATGPLDPPSWRRRRRARMAAARHWAAPAR